MILGLDVSTSCVGLSILDPEGNIIDLIPIDLKNKKKFPSLFSKASFLESFLIDLKVKYSIKKIGIEAALNMFRPGASSAQTISTLLKFNGIVSWIVFKVFNIEPQFVSATSARKKCGILVKKGTKAKKVVLDFLINNNSQFVPFVKYTRNNNVDQKVFDIADAFIIAKSIS